MIQGFFLKGRGTCAFAMVRGGSEEAVRAALYNNKQFSIAWKAITLLPRQFPARFLHAFGILCDLELI
jgi:hypothetical protein